ncbi:hypothetical protein GH733_014380, partial [Mirounga leonina]
MELGLSQRLALMATICYRRLSLPTAAVLLTKLKMKDSESPEVPSVVIGAKGTPYYDQNSHHYNCPADAFAVATSLLNPFTYQQGFERPAKFTGLEPSLKTSRKPQKVLSHQFGAYDWATIKLSKEGPMSAVLGPVLTQLEDAALLPEGEMLHSMFFQGKPLYKGPTSDPNTQKHSNRMKSSIPNVCGEDEFRKFSLITEDVQGKNCLTFMAWIMTKGALWSKKWQIMTKAHVDVKTTDGNRAEEALFELGKLRELPSESNGSGKAIGDRTGYYISSNTDAEKLTKMHIYGVWFTKQLSTRPPCHERADTGASVTSEKHTYHVPSLHSSRFRHHVS